MWLWHPLKAQTVSLLHVPVSRLVATTAFSQDKSSTLVRQFSFFSLQIPCVNFGFVKPHAPRFRYVLFLNWRNGNCNEVLASLSNILRKSTGGRPDLKHSERHIHACHRGLILSSFFFRQIVTLTRSSPTPDHLISTRTYTVPRPHQTKRFTRLILKYTPWHLDSRLLSRTAN